MDLGSFTDFGFWLYHGTQASQAPAPSYATDSTGLYVFVAGIGGLVLLFVYFYKQNQKEQ